ncbi:hypothetical protein D3C72_2024460 [compost metagenome]
MELSLRLAAGTALPLAFLKTKAPKLFTLRVALAPLFTCNLTVILVPSVRAVIPGIETVYVVLLPDVTPYNPA